jgi:hypothetical protein
MAWWCISLEVSVKGLKKCCISSALVETDEDILWNGREEDGNVCSVRNEGSDYEDGDSDTDWWR